MSFVIGELEARRALNASRVDAARTTLVRGLAGTEHFGTNRGFGTLDQLVDNRLEIMTKHESIEPFEQIRVIEEGIMKQC
jgi:hypothetical protein